MEDNEAIVIEGVFKYCEHEGYAESFVCKGPTPKNAYMGPHTFVCIDATDFSKTNPSEQYLKRNIDRELLKAYAGFSGTSLPCIATGNWGGGCFKVYATFICLLFKISADGRVLRLCDL
jgi:hypothetical protein